ncbi:hypothetical protein GCM10007932_39580 [Vibrio penaeicida]|uniref:Uncharacterized protein n=1 Tax=Vibrio penaeicida TaxID=104609 RepID=A0AAV5NX21_9VIBR|nr:hypothetical protein GCM10007932_39580 [Vibrio penaeicida]
MLAEVQEEFVFKVVGPAVIPELKFGLKRVAICALIPIFGFIFSMAIVILSQILRGNRELNR